LVQYRSLPHEEGNSYVFIGLRGCSLSNMAMAALLESRSTNTQRGKWVNAWSLGLGGLDALSRKTQRYRDVWVAIVVCCPETHRPKTWSFCLTTHATRASAPTEGPRITTSVSSCYITFSTTTQKGANPSVDSLPSGAKLERERRRAASEEGLGRSPP
jgi:hypothetical protein